MITSLLTGCNLKQNVWGYLENNHEILNLNNNQDFMGLDILENDLKGKRIILSGENHGISSNETLKIKLMKYLHNKIGVKYYLMEASYSQAYLINKYLTSGDENYLNEIFSSSRGTFANSENMKKFIKELYKFNSQLDDSDKISVIGIDIEFELDSPYEYLRNVLGEKNLPKTFIEAFESNSLYNVKTNAEILLEEIKYNDSYYKNILDEEYIGVLLTLENIITYYECYKIELELKDVSKEWFDIREKKIYENFKQIDEQLGYAKYFGQFGRSHLSSSVIPIFNDVYQKLDTLSSYLRNDEKYKNKVLSLYYMYNDCNYMDPSGQTNSMNITDDIKDEDYYLSKYSNEDCYIFKVNEEINLFERFENIEYIILFNRSKASKYINS